MDDHLDICAFGGLVISRNGVPIGNFDQRKVPALLVYLAAAERPQPREVLAELFWEDRAQSQAQSNLRVALSDLRRHAAPFVEITREAVGMNTHAHWRLDTTTFEQSLSRAGDEVSSLEAAIALYQGDFLQGFFIDSQGFEEWALLERERLRFLIVEALDRLSECCLAHEHYASGLKYARRLLSIDPLREKTYCQMMRLLAFSDEREAALAQYGACRQMLETELGVQPTAKTTALYEQIRAGQLVPEPAAVSSRAAPKPVWQRPRHNLPVMATSFVGREAEIAVLLEQLHRPDCRLLTLVGPGGIGKTRLALAVAQRSLGSFAHGVYFVSLASLTNPDTIVAAIASTLRFQFYQSRDSAEQQLLNFLREKAVLLVLDNFDHLLDGAGLVDHILAAAPGVSVLVTSREPLSLGWEWLYEVRGLALPVSKVDALEDFSAIRLFAERARRVRPGFRLADEREHVIRICQGVEGMPLGIEIAAGWVRMLPCEAIATNLLDLEALQPDVPERHRSLRALFDYTWQHLSPLDRAAMMRLSVFRSSFSAEAAERVTETSLARLAALVNKSLLHRIPVTNRYVMHELLRQYASEQLDDVPELRRQLLERFVTTYSAFLREQSPAILRGQNQAIWEERNNLRYAWALAIKRHHLLLVRKSLRHLFDCFLMDPKGLGVYTADFEQSLAVLRVLQPSPDRDGVLGLVLVMYAVALEAAHGVHSPHFQSLLDEGLTLLRANGTSEELAYVLRLAGDTVSDVALAMSYLEESLALWRQLGDQLEIAQSLQMMGSFCMFRLLDNTRARSLGEQALALFRQEGSHPGEFHSLLNLGVVAMAEGRIRAAKQFYEEALLIARIMDNEAHTAAVLNNLAYCAIHLGEAETAEQYAQQALDIRKQLGNPRWINGGLDTLGDVRYMRGNFDGARTAYRESLEWVESQGLPTGQKAIAFSKLGFAEIALDDFSEAEARFRAALELAVTAQLGWVVLDTLLGTTWLYHCRGRGERALALFGVSAAVSYHDKHVNDEARLRAQFETEFGSDTVAEAIERGKSCDPIQVALEVLAEWEPHT